MGLEIQTSSFQKEDFLQFYDALNKETELLKQYFQEGAFTDNAELLGYEVEASLVDQNYNPLLENSALLKHCNDPLVVPELSKFSFEMNSIPTKVNEDLFKNIHEQLFSRWEGCISAAQALHGKTLMIGCLPTVTEHLLNPASLSHSERCLALNEQIISQSPNQQANVNIEGVNDTLALVKKDILLEATTTSLQIHLQVAQDKAVNFYNAAQLISAPMVALSANAPFVLGKELWDESRIAVFEEIVSVKSKGVNNAPIIGRTSFGFGYAQESLFEPFLENLEQFPVLLPCFTQEANRKLPHVCLQNGTIWRWNRPIVNVTQKPHLRIEHRVNSTGPTICDTIANIGFFLGLVHAVAENPEPANRQLPFVEAQQNFYQCARHSLAANITWTNGSSGKVSELLLEQLIPMARKKLLQMGIDKEAVLYYIDEILVNRVKKNQNGALWQKQYRSKHACSMNELTEAYYERQQTNQPVGFWEL